MKDKESKELSDRLQKLTLEINYHTMSTILVATSALTIRSILLAQEQNIKLTDDMLGSITAHVSEAIAEKYIPDLLTVITDQHSEINNSN